MWIVAVLFIGSFLGFLLQKNLRSFDAYPEWTPRLNLLAKVLVFPLAASCYSLAVILFLLFTYDREVLGDIFADIRTDLREFGDLCLYVLRNNS